MSVNDQRNVITTDLFEIKNGETENSATFIFGNEDHTLGNALRHILIQQSDTDFCGYSVPHPYEPKMNIRLQSKKSSNTTSVDLLKNGLKELEECANILDDTFVAALDKFKN
jgi:DNA-directed RNA polymerase I and III subunit RPAC2